VLGEIVIVAFECRDQVRRGCRRVRELPGVSLLEPGDRQVTRAAKARGARPVGADPERWQPAQRAGAQKRDGICRWVGAGALRQALDLAGDAQNRLPWLEARAQELEHVFCEHARISPGVPAGTNVRVSTSRKVAH
jgi:hypothetical protein